MRRLPLAAFAGLAVATVAAFFVTQHLKVSLPLVQGTPKPDPQVISPGCSGRSRVARLSFYLQLRADDVGVYIVDPAGHVIRTLTSNRHMRRGIRNPDGNFPWNGRTDSGAVAHDGTYFWRIVFHGQGRTVQLPVPVIVRSRSAHSGHGCPGAAGPTNTRT
ncbi:MAG: hypothetical protein M3Y17_02075 [Actinomycetota bacterium]|nr:hypothetical protein [Actinomycetota bacterium]